MNTGDLRKGWADALFEQAKAHQECFIAGVRAADETGPSARKLTRLIAASDEAVNFLDAAGRGWLSAQELKMAAHVLRAAIVEARKP